MRIGTPSFVGDRLVEAREARGLTATSLSQMVDVSAPTISHYEHGRQTPSPEILERLSRVLNCPQKYFLNPVRTLPGLVDWRSASSATKTSRAKAIRRACWLMETVEYLKARLDFPPLLIPDIRVPKEVEHIGSDLIEFAAGQCRELWNLGAGPVSNVVRTLEVNGVIVSRTNLEAETLDAFSTWPDGERSPYVVLSSLKASSSRSRFDAAHELGHIVLHRHLRENRSLAVRKLIENQAHRFAGAFLLPEESFAKDVWAPTLNSFRALKPHWKVSIQVMISRCQDLGIMDDGQVKRAWINLSRNGWRKEEPWDDRLPIEQPELLRKSFEVLISSGESTPEQISAELQLPCADVEDLCGLPNGYLRGLIQEEVRPKLKKPSDGLSGPIRVVTFPKI